MDNKRALPALPSCQQLIDILPTPFVIIGRDYRIKAANRRYLEQYQASPEKIIDNFCYKISHHSDVPCRQHGEHCPLDEVFKTRRTTHVIHTHYDAVGNQETVQLQATPIFDEQGEVIAMGESINRLASLDETRERLLGQSAAMLRLTEMLLRVAPTMTTVLLQGESGVGKECVAEYIHHNSSRAKGPFVVVDSTTLGETLIESELFGHERGAFTSADKQKKGLIEAANGGTLFIDEIGELPLNLQTKLLRLLETSQIRRVGATEVLDVDIRVIAATHRDLREMVQARSFREDLYFRLTSFPIYIPPLRERKEDIVYLAEYFLSRTENAGHGLLPLSPEIQDILLHHDYPGNVRELRNIMERAAILAHEGSLQLEHFPFLHEEQLERGDAATSSGLHTQLLNRRHSHIDESRLLSVLAKFNGHRASAARELGMSERTLYRHLQRVRGEES